MDEDRISGAAAELKGKVKEGIGSLAGDRETEAEGHAERLGGAAQRTLGQARDSLRDAADSLHQRAGSIGGYIDQAIHERPLTALLAAGAVGYVLGLLIHRR